MSEKRFYQQLHPELFSDSRTVKKGALSEEMFQMYLENLTSQSKEKEFEDFCRKLLEVTICPNLLPQTGPTGGGDSKVDSETYPVSESIAETWFTGYAEKAHSERWAFAISAKKEWRPKCKSDVNKIVKTNEDFGRNYKKIFFLTNQFVSDKKRADLEDELRKEYSIDIRILDRTWLMENTFKDDNIMIAIKAFNMSELLLEENEEGTMDIQRRRRLEEIDREFLNIESLRPSRIIKLSKEYIENLRELQVSKSKAVDMLERNVRFAKKYGIKLDYVTALYDYAWTIIWWYEDREIYYEKYLEIEEIYKQNKGNYYILQKLSTLWITLNTNHKNGVKNINDVDKHTDFITSAFNRFIEDENNPQRSLLARFDYQFIRMQLVDDFRGVVEEYIEILNHIDFNNKIDLFQLKKVLELPILKDEPKYDELFEKVILKLSEAQKNKSSSEMLINRGDDYLQNNKATQAIKYYSRALMKLYQEDSKEDLIKTLIKLGASFENIGLMWGARSYYLRAFTDAFNLYFEEGRINPGLFISPRHLKHIELNLGRIDYALEMNEVEMNGFQLYPYSINEDFELERYTYFDGLLAVYLLNLSLSVIDQLNQLPDYLSDWDLHISSAALKYQLGYIDNEYIKILGSEEKVNSFMEDLYNQPASKDYKNIIRTNTDPEIQTIGSKIFGCEMFIKTNNNRIEQEFAATIFALFENTFALVDLTTFKPVLESFIIEVESVNNQEFGIDIEQNENIVKVKISSVENLIDYSNRNIVSQKLIALLSIFVSKMIVFEEDFARFKVFFEDENVLFRVFNHSTSLNTFIAFEGDDIFSKEEYMKYPIKRKDKVFNPLSDESPYKELGPISYNFDEEIDLSNVMHKDIITSNIINLPLWDKALWQGIFAVPSNVIDVNAYIGLVYKEEKGLDIFREWKKNNSEVTIGIITGIDKNNPLWYRVIIGYDIFSKYTPIKETEHIIGITSRLHTMEAENTNTIKILSEIKSEEEQFNFIPVLVDDFINQKFRFDLEIRKKVETIILKDVSEINENDYFLHQGILPSDSPVNPNNEDRYIEKIIKEKQKYKQ